MGKNGLVLEGGGMRGLYTAGVLDCFLDHGTSFDYAIGVSAGVCNGVSFISGQRGRSCKINLDYCADSRYVGARNLLKSGSMFGMDFIFDEIPMRLNVFDFEAFRNSPTDFVIGVTSVETGKPVYFSKSEFCEDPDCSRLNRVARASSAIPVFSPVVEFEGASFLDGGTSDPIPVRRALADGCEKVVVVLTRHRGFVRQPEGFRGVYRRLYRKHPQMARCLDERHQVYNGTLQYIDKLEREGRALVIAPEQPITLGRFERRPEKLKALYETGLREAGAKCAKVEEFLRD